MTTKNTCLKGKGCHHTHLAVADSVVTTLLVILDLAITDVPMINTITTPITNSIAVSDLLSTIRTRMCMMASTGTDNVMPT